ncbi:hypothetical protein MUP77_18920 [Candidatus Bathyarchaeota archaeon]|nr:hypothetical protein [Candidatus Bathyarchaeota archaeon]
MGKTVPSYRMALEFEIERWKYFRKALQSEEEREAFDWLMDMCRNNAMASGAACNPVIFEPMVMSILLAQRKLLQEVEYKLNEVLWQEICVQENEKERESKQ